MKKKITFVLLVFILIDQISAQDNDSIFRQIITKDLKHRYGIEYSHLDPLQISYLSLGANPNKGIFYKINEGKNVYYLYNGFFNACKIGGCTVSGENSESEMFEYFNYYILYDSVARVLNTKIYYTNVSQGTEISDSLWLLQFVGYDGSRELLVDNDISAISGATTSVFSIVNDISIKTQFLRNILSGSIYSLYTGAAQGTTFSIYYNSKSQDRIIKAIDSIFTLMDTTFSLCNPGSLLFRINNGKAEQNVSGHFERLFNISQKISDKTQGAFDLTAGYAYRLQKQGIQTSHKFSYKDVFIKQHVLYKKDTTLKLDFNAIAQGYTIDLIAEYFLKNNIEDFLIELGGEIRGNGKNEYGSFWKIEVDESVAMHNNDQEKEIVLNNVSIATSGNYKSFYKSSEGISGHIIDPMTGRSANSDLFGVSVISKSCAVADAFATALFVMGYDKAQLFLSKNKKIKGILFQNAVSEKTEK